MARLKNYCLVSTILVILVIHLPESALGQQRDILRNNQLNLAIILSINCSTLYTATCPTTPSYSGPGKNVLMAIPSALDHLNNEAQLRHITNVTVKVINTFGLPSQSLKQTLIMSKDENIAAVIGTDETCTHEQMIARLNQKLVISHMCSPLITASELNRSTFVQLKGSYSDIGIAIVDYVNYFGWDRVVVLIFTYGDFPEFRAMRESLLATLYKRNIKIVRIYEIRSSTVANYYAPTKSSPVILRYAKIIMETYLTTKVYLTLTNFATLYDVLYFMDTMSRMGLLQTGEYNVVLATRRTSNTVYNGSDATSQFFFNPPTLSTTPDLLRQIPKREITQIYRTAALVTESPPMAVNSWRLLVTRMLKLTTANLPCPPLCQFEVASFSAGFIAPVEAGYLYDAIVHYVKTVDNLIHSDTSTLPSWTSVLGYFRNTTINSVTGLELYIGKDGSVINNVTISSVIQAATGIVGMYPVGHFRLKTDNNEKVWYLYFYNQTFPLNWIHGIKPAASPKCGFDGSLCVKVQDYISSIIAIAAAFTVCCVSVAAIYIYRRRQFDNQLQALLWKIDAKDLILLSSEQPFGSTTSFGRDSLASLESAVSMRMYKSQSDLRRQTRLQKEITRGETKHTFYPFDKSNHRRTIRRNQESQETLWAELSNFGTAICNGTTVALKRVHKNEVQMTLTVKTELKLTTETHHSNINRVLGLVYEPPKIAIVSEYCPRGSLKDVLETPEIHLDRMFLASLVFDIIRGVQYLQASIFGCHGRLKSSNCLIDIRWTVRLSEFGLFLFRNGEQSPATQEEKCRKLLWTAPEILRRDSFNAANAQLSKSADVYAFGIILHEIFGRKGPFGAEDLLDPVEIIHNVTFPTPQEPLTRPDMAAVTEAPIYVRNVMQECWDETQSARPTFTEIRKKLEPLREGLKPNLLDNLMAIMEKYTSNLDVLVQERVKELEEEQAKSEHLLSLMLPRKIIDCLKRGQTVEPEWFDSVTVYFSDICGFASMIRGKNPIEVVHFLHTVYSTFDKLIDDFDVYKVETISDTYMVASGVPIRNGNKHAGEIASMALRLVKAAKDLTIREMSGDVVKLRIGIHTGPCVASVIGLIMPRYCLFGDTVNTASRLESNGEALRIHCSAACRNELCALGGYELHERGYVVMKGKGEVLTYWLQNEDANYRTARLKKTADIEVLESEETL